MRIGPIAAVLVALAAPDQTGLAPMGLSGRDSHRSSSPTGDFETGRKETVAVVYDYFEIRLGKNRFSHTINTEQPRQRPLSDLVCATRLTCMNGCSRAYIQSHRRFAIGSVDPAPGGVGPQGGGAKN